MKLKAFMLVLLLTGFVELQSHAFGAESQTKTGTVRKVDAAARQIVVMVTWEWTFTVAETTKIMSGDKDIKFTDVEVGSTVSVDYVKDGETRTALKIVVTKKKE